MPNVDGMFKKLEALKVILLQEGRIDLEHLIEEAYFIGFSAGYEDGLEDGAEEVRNNLL